MKVISVTLEKHHVEYINKNCIVLSQFFRQKLDKIMKHEHLIEDKSI